MMMAQNSQSKLLDSSLVPTVVEACRLYEANGGHLTLFNELDETN